MSVIRGLRLTLSGVTAMAALSFAVAGPAVAAPLPNKTGQPQPASGQLAPSALLSTPRVAQAPAANSNCGGYSSDSTPPSTIRVLRYAQHTSVGAPVPGTEIGVVNVPFQEYVKDVLPSEWVTSWQTASLQAGAMSVKTYAWYWVNHWRGGSYGGSCYNVDDSINYQRYIPGSSTSVTNSAVQSTWNSVMTKNGAVFQASYQATLTGNPSEACGTGLSRYPNTLSQWGSQNCALAGHSWQSILGAYYPGLSIGGSSGAATSPVSMDAGATHVAFVDGNGNVANDWVSNGAWQGPSGIGGKARVDSPVVLNANADHAFFIDADGNVMNDWVSNGAWQGPSAIGGKARPGSPIATNAAGTMVAFVDMNGNLVNDWVSNGAWQGPSGMGGQPRGDSPLAFNAAGDHIFFVDGDGSVANDWVSNGAWQGPSGVGGKARAGSGLATDASGTHVAFVDTNGNLANDWVSNGAWQGPSGMGGQPRGDSPLAFNAAGDHIFFVDGDGSVANDWVSNGAWQGPSGVGGKARAGSGLATDASGTHVAFVDTNGNLANDWVSNGAWQGPSGLGGTSR
ncbi:SpoIID/LytB domain-containing protein [Streptomyces sp. NBC_01207]|uniref:SpoIID/LytB domain-containing protein n=1 Tax=Streptomyces sp. NBC_01207 TaxID=2903772 RepID=UPI002E100E43|nr:hypothetical protein OG457_09080 [Streptomyces sp. NBC_01207]